MDGKRYEGRRTAPEIRRTIPAPMVRKAGVILAFALLACAFVPASSQMPAIAPGVSVGGIAVGGLTSEPARAKLEDAFAKSIPIVHGKRHWWASPQRLGAGAAIDVGISRALEAGTGDRVDLGVAYSRDDLRRFVNEIARTFDRAPVDARFVGVTGNHQPQIDESVDGVAARRA